MSKFIKIKRTALAVLFAVAVFALGFAVAGCTSDSACTHENTTETTTVEATCTEEGTVTVTCNDCDEVIEVKTIAALGHDYATDSSLSVAATCTADGKTVEVCSRCGDTRETTIEKTGHNYSSEVTAATCSVQGYTTYTCSVCGDSYVADYTEATGAHNYSSEVTEATCLAQGYTTYTCSVCGDSYVADYIEATGAHNYSSEVTAATCSAQGYTTYTCSVCGDSYVTDYTDAAGHVWTGNTCEGQTCSVCGAQVPATTSHDYVTTAAASCSADVEATYVCSVCGDTYTATLPAIAHTYETDGDGNVVWTLSGDSELKEGTTCTYVTTYYAICTVCGAKTENATESTVHSYALTVTSAATCAEAGTKEMVCSGCGEVQEGTAVSYYGEHKYDDGTTSGDTTVYTCSVCGGTKTSYSGNTATVSTSTLESDVELGNGTVISMSGDAVGGLTQSDNLSLAADTLSDNELTGAGLSEEDLDRVGDSEVYNITLSEGGENITTFSGTVTVKLPYTLSEGEDETNITIFYLGSEGLEVIENAVYSDGYVVFETSHFSYYTVGKYTPAELCAKYGHNVKVISQDPTCLVGGYYIEICTRCNSTLVNETYAALGHNYVENITKKATCTENGSVTYTCANCGASYSGVLAATGHDWVLDSEKSAAATCTAAGHNDYYCTKCELTYSTDLAQLSHKYTAVTTVPTCTAYGYTTYTCSLCGGSYIADYVAATGHTFDSDAECIDRTCLVCNAVVKATAEHVYNESGVCTVCGHGCDHTYVSTVIAATCTEDGYTLNECSKCGSTYISDYVTAKGHTYTTDLTKCDVCGETNNGIVDIFNSIIENCYSYEYTLKLTDVTLSATIDYETYGEKNDVTYTIDAAELYVKYEDGLIIIYGDCAVTVSGIESDNGETVETETSTFEGNVYGDGEYFYVYSDSDGYVSIHRSSYEEIFGDYYDILYADAETTAQYNEMLDEILENELVQQWLAVMEDNSGLANQIAAEAFFSLFTVTSTESGYEYALNLDGLAELNENLNTLTVAELIDEYLGEGTYSSLGSYLTSLEDKTLYAAITEILLYGEDYGVTSDLVFATINTLVTLYTGNEDFDIESFLKDDSEETYLIGEMTISEILAEYAGIDDYDRVLTALEEYGKLNVYETLLGYDLDEYSGSYITDIDIYGIIADLTSGDVISLVFTADKNYAITSVKLVFDEASIGSTSYRYYDSSAGYDENGNIVESEGGYKVYYTMVMTLNGTLDVDYSCNLPEGYDSYKTEIESISTSIIDTIKAACLASESGTIYVNIYSSFGVNSDGTVYYTYDRYGTQIVITDISKLENLTIRYDCTDTYYIYTSIESDGYYTSLYLYTDVKNNKLSTNSFHDYQIDNSLAPSGTPTSADEVDCEECYYTYYKCSICGEIKCVSNWKYHECEYRYSLVVEGGSCEDGVIEECYCSVCGNILSMCTFEWHYTTTEEIAKLTCTSKTYNGTMTVYCESCLCGYYSYIYYESDDGCQFNDYTVEEYLYAADGTTIIGEIDKYQCYYTGCQNYYLLKRYYCSTNGNSVYTYYQYNTETEDWSAVYTYTSTSEHHSTIYKDGDYTDSNGNSVSWYGYLCEYCDYGYKYIYKNNSDGYQIYEGYERTASNGTVTYSWYYKYNRDSSGSIINKDYYENDEYQYTYTSSSSYDETGLYTYIYNYTYADGSTSKTIDKYRYDSYGRFVYYYDATEKDGVITHYYTYSYEFVDGDTCYALYSYEDCYYYSDGEVSKDADSYYTYYHPYTSSYDNDNGTCSQTYTYGWYCPICNMTTSTYTTINGHNWYYNSSLGVYVCRNCGLESENASSSEIVLEEFTYNDTYGKDGYLALGYYYPYDSEDMIISYTLVPVDSQENLDLTDDSYIELDDILTVDDTGSIIYISLEDLEAIAAEKGVSLSDYDLRISFWYYYGNDVTSITLTDLLVESVAE